MEESQSGDEDGEKGSDTKADCYLQEENNAEEAEDEKDEEHEDEDEVEEDQEESGEDEEEDDEQHDVGEDDLEEHLQEGKAAATEEIVSKVKSFEFLRMFHHHHQFFLGDE